MRTHTHPINDVMDRIKLRIVSLLFIISENNNSQEKKAILTVLCSVLTWLDIYELEMSVCSNNVVEVLLLNRCYKKWVHHKYLINFVHCKWRFEFLYHQISKRIEKKFGFFSLDNQSFYQWCQDMTRNATRYVYLW